MKKFLAFFVFVASLFASAHTADLLSESDVKVFISRNQRAIDEIKRTQEIHLGYAVAEFAKNQIMAQYHFRGGASEIVDQVIEGKVNGFKKIILSVLKGIGVGGLSKSNRKATSREHMAGYLALYTVGINSEVATPLGISSVLSTPHKKHLEICNGIIRSAHAIRENNEGARTFLSTLFTNAARKLEVKPERHPDQFGGWILEPGKPMRSAEITKLPIPQRDKEYAQRYDVRMLDLGGTVDQRYRRLGATLSFEQAVNGFFVKGVYPNIREDLAIVRSVRSGRTELTARGQRALETCFEYSIDSLAQGGEIVVLSADQEMSGLARLC